MNPPDETAPAPRTDGRAVRKKVASRVGAARGWYAGSLVEDIFTQLKAVDFFNWTLIFGAELLWSALPFIILLSSLANQRVDDDLSRAPASVATGHSPSFLGRSRGVARSLAAKR